jgi:signal transduction histidine kinase
MREAQPKPRHAKTARRPALVRPGGRGDVERLAEVALLLARARAVDEAMPAALAAAAKARPLRAVVLVRGGLARPRTRVWHAPHVSPAEIRGAASRARVAYAYLAGCARADLAELEAEDALVEPIDVRAAENGAAVGGASLVVPLLAARDEVLGALHVEAAARLGDAGRAFVNALGQTVALALAREKLASEAAADARRAALLAEASRRLAISLADRAVLDRLARFAASRVADACVIALAERQLGRRRIQAGSGRLPAAAVARTVEDLAPRVIARGAPLELGADRASREALRAIGASGGACLPLRTRGRTLGVIAFFTAEKSSHGPVDLVVAEVLARRASRAIENALLYREALEAVKSRDDLLALVSHDLKNPLSVVLLNLRLARRVALGEAREALPELLESSRRSAERMLRLVQDLLDTASIEAGRLAIEPAPQAAEALVASALDLLRPIAARKSVLLRFRVPDKTPPVLVDRDRFLQVLGNLVGNAVRFTSSGGSVEVRAETRRGAVCFSVRDTGSGIAPKDLPHVFDRFWQARRTARGGTGLGLSIAKGIVEAHGGRIWAESVLGEGSTFSFTLPTSRRRARASR